MVSAEFPVIRTSKARGLEKGRRTDNAKPSLYTVSCSPSPLTSIRQLLQACQPCRMQLVSISGYSSVGRASDCRMLQPSDGPWFDSGWPDLCCLRGRWGPPKHPYTDNQYTTPKFALFCVHGALKVSSSERHEGVPEVTGEGCACLGFRASHRTPTQP